MQVQQIKISDIKPYDNNPRKNHAAVDVVVESIKRYGFQQPIVVDKDMIIIVGHTRFKAAKKLKMTEVPVVVADQLNEEEVIAYRLADNKTNEYALWDDSQLSTELQSLLDRLNSLSEVSDYTAFSELEIDRLINGKNYSSEYTEDKVQPNKEIKKRIALLVLKNSYVNRGVATYINGWLEWGIRQGVQVDVISDSDDISNNQFKRYEDSSNWIIPAEDYQDSDLVPEDVESGDTNDFEDYHDTHNWIGSADQKTDLRVAMRSPIIRLQGSLDLRNSLLTALTKYSYDAIILNTIDCLFTAVSLGLHQNHPNLYYVSHSIQDIGQGPNNFITSLTKSLLLESGIKVICQSEWVKKVFINHTGIDKEKVTAFIPMLGQPELIDFTPDIQRKGVLYIGPYEERKGAEVYIEAVKKSGYPALVITPSIKSADKFKKRFLEENIEHEIHVALTGKDKVNVIRRAAVAVIPSITETFCFTAFEAAHLCRTIIPSEYDWTEAHRDWCEIVPTNNISNAIKMHYDQPIKDSAKQALIQAFDRTDIQALLIMESEQRSDRQENALTKYLIKNKGQASIESYFQQRPSSVRNVLDEMFYVIRLQNHSDYKFTHTKDRTYISIKDWVDTRISKDEINENLLALLNLENIIE